MTGEHESEGGANFKFVFARRFFKYYNKENKQFIILTM
jgi:hypothetical protein